MAETVTLGEINVTATKEADAVPGSTDIDKSELDEKKSSTSDTSRLLEDVPGLSIYSAGGISGLPVIHGLADDRLRIQVDGVDLMSACPNHMNSALSYIAPTRVDRIQVFSGITPVSVGGDSLGGSILVESAAPQFAEADQDAYATGQLGSYYRSNSNAVGYNLEATWVGHDINLSYTESHARADNYTAGGEFKATEPGTEGGEIIPGDVVASSAYNGVVNRDFNMALQQGSHLFQLGIGQQQVDFEGFPNQRMDMTYNNNTLINLRYSGQYDWGEMKARIYSQDTEHKMDMGPDRYQYGTGMPMDSEATSNGGMLQGTFFPSYRDALILGTEYQYYTLYDWWPAVGGSMGPNDFWNIDYGRRNKIDTYADWERDWSPAWFSQIGIRGSRVITDAAPVQGYDNSLAGTWGNDATAFNLLEHERTDLNWDVAALLRFTPDKTRTYEGGYARKSRSPNIYQRYPWSTNPMAALMNNFVGDGNGYIGNIDLKPEVAHTLSITGDWHDERNENWGFKTTAYYTYIEDYIDAKRCDFSQCSELNEATTSGFVLLQYVNHDAELYGVDVSGHRSFSETEKYGRFTGKGVLNYVRGKNRTTDDNLYNMMPLNLKLSVVQDLQHWRNTVEFQAVDAKTKVSWVRNEIPTDSYTLLHLRTRYEWKQLQLDFSIENVFDKLYAMPLGGAYLGQGASMTSNGIPWGVVVPGMGRSFNISLGLSF